MNPPPPRKEAVRSFRLSREEQAALVASVTAASGPEPHDIRQDQVSMGPEQGLDSQPGSGLDQPEEPGPTRDTSVAREPPPALPETSLAHQLLDVFAQEAYELLDSLQQALATLSRRPAAEAVYEARRAMHTIKGGARMCGLRGLADLALACESLIESSPQDTLPRQVIDLLLEATREIRPAVRRPAEGPGSDADLAACAARLRSVGRGSPVIPTPREHAAPAPSAAAEDQAPAGSADTAPEQPECGATPAVPPAGQLRVPAPPADFEPRAPRPESPPERGPEPVSAHQSLAAQLLEVFVEEAGEMLDILHTCLERLERGPDEAAMVEARRAVHTIKGGARMCGRGQMAELSHACEDVIGRPAPGQQSLSAAAVAVLFAAEQELRASLATPNSGPGSDDSVRALTQRLLAAHVRAEGAAEPGSRLSEAAALAPPASPNGGSLAGATGVETPPAEPPAMPRVSESVITALAQSVPTAGAGEPTPLDPVDLTEAVQTPPPTSVAVPHVVDLVPAESPAVSAANGTAPRPSGPQREDAPGTGVPAPSKGHARPTVPTVPTAPAAGHAAPRPRPEDTTGQRPGRPEPAAPTTPAAAEQPRPRALQNARLLARPASTATVPTNRLGIDLDKVEALVAKVTEIVANRTASHGLVETLANTVGEMARVVNRLQSVAISLHYQITAQGRDSVTEPPAGALELETYGPIHQLLLQLQEAAADQQALVQGITDVVARKRALAAVETRLDTELQGALLNMRLLPLGHLRVRLDQVVRSTAAAAGREVRWTMEGQEVALDKHVCDRLFEPLMHLLRNCVDHGIEPPLERETRGKPRSGQITIRAAVEGNQAIISVSDDGRGIDPDRVATAAVARGLVTAEHARSLSTREKLDLVFLPGFSTAREVTEISGRGMGMDIVREICTRMGGSVSLGQRQGGGTMVTMQVPLSLSVVQCLITRESGRLLAIPASQVSAVQLVAPTAISRHRDGGLRLRLGSATLRLFLLPGSDATSITDAGEFEQRTVLLIPYHGERAAVLVDEIVEEEEQIIKPLPLLLQGVDRLLGAVMLGDGTPAPVLNLPPILDRGSPPAAAPAVAPAPAPAEQIVLVVDDSLTMRLALTHTLEHAGYLVETARDGQEALEHIRANGMPNLVTLDIEMPFMDGLETLYAIRHLPGGETLPIFMLSSRTGQKHLRTAARMGANRYFTKPYHDSEFVAAAHGATGLPARIEAKLSGTIGGN
jgi:chemosensory pili system protein ChpA (sensor histidine kinase/response regulator)